MVLAWSFGQEATESFAVIATTYTMQNAQPSILRLWILKAQVQLVEARQLFIHLFSSFPKVKLVFPLSLINGLNDHFTIDGDGTENMYSLAVYMELKEPSSIQHFISDLVDCRNKSTLVNFLTKSWDPREFIHRTRQRGLSGRSSSSSQLIGVCTTPL